MGRCLTPAQVPVRTYVRTCGRTPSVCLVPAPQGALAHQDRYEHPTLVSGRNLHFVVYASVPAPQGDARGLLRVPL